MAIAFSPDGLVPRPAGLVLASAGNDAVARFWDPLSGELTALTIGLLGLAGIPQPDWLVVMPIMVGGWLIGKLWIRWQYR